MTWESIDLFQLTADRLQSLVVTIYTIAMQELERAYANLFDQVDEEIAAASDESKHEDLTQYRWSLDYEKKEQVRSLAAMALAMLGSLIDSFLDEARKEMNKTHPATKKDYAGKSVLLKRVTEFQDRFQIDLTRINGFATVQEIILARHSCIHGGCAPSEDYLKQTKCRMLDDDKKINLTLGQLKELVAETSDFAKVLYQHLATARAENRKVLAGGSVEQN
jgi:hypothetical protein